MIADMFLKTFPKRAPREPDARRLLLRRAASVLLALGARPAIARPDTDDAAWPRVLVLGDSLSAEYGIARGSGWVSLLSRALAERARPLKVINASVSGETTAGGLSRLPALLERHRPAMVIIELGGNDALRGLSLDSTRSNLVAMVRAVRAAKARAVLIGMRMPPNYGREWGERFAALFAEVARTQQALLVPFLLEGFAEDERLFQEDRIHPRAAAQGQMLTNVTKVLDPHWSALSSLPSPRP